MRILLSSLQGPQRHAVPRYDFWRTYFLRGLEEAGHECVEVPNVDWAGGLVPGVELDAWRGRTWEAVRGFIRNEFDRRPIHLFLSYLYPKQVDISAIKELQRMGIPCVNFFCDNVREFRQVPKEYYGFALHWVPEFEALAIYREAGLAHVHAPMPCWVPPEFRTVPTADTEPPTFMGSADILRRDFFARALEHGADFVVRGPGWATETQTEQSSRSVVKMIFNQMNLAWHHGVGALFQRINSKLRPLRSRGIPASNIRDAVFGQQYFQITRDAIVAIGINRVPTPRSSDRHPLVYSRLRDIEAPMLGACYLTEWTAGLEKLYDIGTEIETYRTPDELRLKLNELRQNNPRRLIMRERAQRRALHEHSVASSLVRLREKLGV